jgi:hypothetical protein
MGGQNCPGTLFARQRRCFGYAVISPFRGMAKHGKDGLVFFETHGVIATVACHHQAAVHLQDNFQFLAVQDNTLLNGTVFFSRTALSSGSCRLVTAESNDVAHNFLQYPTSLLPEVKIMTFSGSVVKTNRDLNR